MDYIRNDYETILARKEAQEEGSYTCYLFEQGLDKILKKVGEESTEMVIAAKTPTKTAATTKSAVAILSVKPALIVYLRKHILTQIY